MDDRRRLESECQRIVENQSQIISKCTNNMEKFNNSQNRLQRKEIKDELAKDVSVGQGFRDRLKQIIHTLDFSKSKLPSSDQKALYTSLKSFDSFIEKYNKFLTQAIESEARLEPPPQPVVPDRNLVWIEDKVSKLKTYLSAQEAEIDTKKGGKNRDVRTTLRIQIRQTTAHISKMESIKEAYLRKQVPIDSLKNSQTSIDDFVDGLVNGREMLDDPLVYGQLKDVGQPLVCNPVPSSPLSQRKGLQARTPVKQFFPQPEAPSQPAQAIPTKKDIPMQRSTGKQKVDSECPDVPPESEIPRDVFDSFSNDMRKRLKSLMSSNYDQPIYHINERLPFVPFYAAVEVPDCHPKELNKLHMSFNFYKSLDSELLFTLFYYMPETIVQYIAVKALKERGWRYQPNEVTWFRLVNKETNEYNYFDFRKWVEMGNCQDIVRPELFEDSVDVHFD